jgi:hypothetical protein
MTESDFVVIMDVGEQMPLISLNPESRSSLGSQVTEQGSNPFF